jgi:hypothetical protein
LIPQCLSDYHAHACLAPLCSAAAAAVIRWAKGEAGPGPNDFTYNERFEFYTNTKAQQYYKDYVAAIVNRYK